MEDLNRDQTMSKTESYHQHKVSIRPEDMVVGQNHITDRFTATGIELPNGQTGSATWYQIKIPIFFPDKRVGPINDFRSIRFMRMFPTDFEQPVVLRFAAMDLVRGEWRRYPFSLDGIREDVPTDEGSNTVFEVNAVQSRGERIANPDSLRPSTGDRPTGTLRHRLPAAAERAIALSPGVRAFGWRCSGRIQNLSMDMRMFKRLKMFVHAEAGDNRPLRDNDLGIFVRLGSDYNQNYYEYEIPMKVTN